DDLAGPVRSDNAVRQRKHSRRHRARFRDSFLGGFRWLWHHVKRSRGGLKWVWSAFRGGLERMHTAHYRVNVRAFFVLLLTFAAQACGVHLVHGYQLRRLAPDLLALADQAEAQGKLAQAADFLTQYLGLAPEDDAAQARYAKLRYQLARARPAR